MIFYLVQGISLAICNNITERDIFSLTHLADVNHEQPAASMITTVTRTTTQLSILTKQSSEIFVSYFAINHSFRANSFFANHPGEIEDSTDQQISNNLENVAVTCEPSVPNKTPSELSVAVMVFP